MFLCSSIICATATSMKILIVGRSLQGTGAGGIIRIAMITISDIFSVRYVSPSSLNNKTRCTMMRIRMSGSEIMSKILQCDGFCCYKTLSSSALRYWHSINTSQPPYICLRHPRGSLGYRRRYRPRTWWHSHRTPVLALGLLD